MDGRFKDISRRFFNQMNKLNTIGLNPKKYPSCEEIIEVLKEVCETQEPLLYLLMIRDIQLTRSCDIKLPAVGEKETIHQCLIRCILRLKSKHGLFVIQDFGDQVTEVVQEEKKTNITIKNQ